MSSSPIDNMSQPAVIDNQQMTAAQPAVIDDQAEEARRTRRRRVATVEIPEEIHALALLLGRDAGDLIQDLLAAQVASVRVQVSKALCEVLP